MCERVAAAAAEMTLRVRGTTCFDVPVAGSTIASTTCGCTHTPPFATVLMAASISTGVVSTPWPNDASA